MFARISVQKSGGERGTRPRRKKWGDVVPPRPRPTTPLRSNGVSKKVAHTRLPSVGFRSWSWFLVVSPQVTWVINPTVGCHYLPPGLQLPSQLLRGLLPISLLGERRHDGCEQFGEFFKSRVWSKVVEGSTLIFEDNWISLKHSARQKPARFVRPFW